MQKKYEMTQYEAAKKKRLLVSSLILLFLVPLTIYAGIAFLGDRKYFDSALYNYPVFYGV